MDDFQALVFSLGEHTVSYIGKDHLKQLAVFGDDVTGTAHVEICLESNAWDEHTRAIEKMLDVRLMFLDDISIDYDFVEEDNCTAVLAEHSDFAYAAG